MPVRRKKNLWVEFVKKESRRLGLSYPCAVGDPRVKRDYKIYKRAKQSGMPDLE